MEERLQMPWKPKAESIGIFRSASSKQRAWWEVPVLVHITIPALPGYLYLLLWAVSALLIATGGAGTRVARFGHQVEGWAYIQLLLGIISYPVAWVLVIVLSIVKFHCWATKVGWLVVVVGTVLWLTMFKIVWGGPW
jgi:hypothetical protein